ncbi:hypothetical protein EV198_1172 [Roseivirga ehrenbergii]|uniref:PH domain-containing protein n=1 Tax=Roseivirga ehrenbergii (strain DSM 102268 / JCM 13514 / KCTC 12282 / NCIMB 14502 / KMM 6017) TaxID=279360 RepID=A0A150X6J5_ROSEK|nr:hypothetical protein [Roseivirga ehrenbergii]KYG74369.1 hypothetical protein MB14_03925 [Roseivirga ehrenbergii]TCL14332.1 hypothetical protein EV198_1172 [Roseivirga ehrenbergii]
MIINYRLSDSQRKKYFILPLAKLLTAIVVFTLIAMYWFNTDAENLPFIVGITWSWVGLIHVLPLLILAAHHLKVSKGVSFVIDTTNWEYRYKKADFDLTFKASHIKRVVKVMSPPKYDGRRDFLGFGYFYYWEVTLVDETLLSLSCMLLDSDEFLGYENERKKQLFPIPKRGIKPQQ